MTLLRSIATELRNHRTAYAVSIGVGLLVVVGVFLLGALTRSYTPPATAHGIEWITTPVVLFLHSGGDVFLTLVSFLLGLSVTVTLTWIERRISAVQAQR